MCMLQYQSFMLSISNIKIGLVIISKVIISKLVTTFVSWAIQKDPFDGTMLITITY